MIGCARRFGVGLLLLFVLSSNASAQSLGQTQMLLAGTA